MRARTPAEVKAIERLKVDRPEWIVLDEVPDRKQSIYLQCELGFKHLKKIHLIDTPPTIGTVVDKTGYFKVKLSKIQPELTVIGEYLGAYIKVRVIDEEGLEYGVQPSYLLSGQRPTIQLAIDQTDCFKKRLYKIQPELTVIGEYLGAYIKVRVIDEGGFEYGVLPSYLLSGQRPTIQLAIDQTDCFKKKLYKIQPELTVIGEYLGASVKVRVKDVECFEFSVVPKGLLQGRRPTIKTAVNKTDHFKKQLSKIQPELTVVGDYKNKRTKIRVKDKDGLDYYSTTSNLLIGHIPTIETAVDKTLHFSTRSKKIHDGKYGYSKLLYKNDTTKVVIVCPTHGDFLQNPSNHLRGSGCPSCVDHNYYTNEENYNKPCHLYILKFKSEEEEFYKIGVSVRMKERMSCYKHEVKGNYNMEQVSLYSTTVHEAYHLLEQPILKLIKESGDQYFPKHSFVGHTECFKDLAFVLDQLEQKNVF